ncbi:hypothetical protein PHYBLDRAFT_188277 [Phycomyces blakesleeanus NRRL 1555(-)]|uniref:Uncharacterized protein n=1 Tax=Phycomyces blakesleeanus (strain ATCC 8743b / DSM 1359 / FGSC 10004 / NBRC 33097 / NRRL 1555) TaxID=763407 RepID=A0A167L3K2_PHYB8|nr:hypothetical protein PHYBLDRAFT_188277 [Phycomyces blakesleeanus NRRL 1555(-)]OAD69516.1 hypothetical protein PHYBLDRAFT_188277 [Phycomyces blakesleeanus NRRL 1555(-)]|eukprot:XP_018287556.1 hypothetical protein PHYBLDRAFT_188277 [Phycomyces blakesleeanus NRRL 1555(-)]
MTNMLPPKSKYKECPRHILTLGKFDGSAILALLKLGEKHILAKTIAVHMSHTNDPISAMYTIPQEPWDNRLIRNDPRIIFGSSKGFARIYRIKVHDKNNMQSVPVTPIGDFVLYRNEPITHLSGIRLSQNVRSIISMGQDSNKNFGRRKSKTYVVIIQVLGNGLTRLVKYLWPSDIMKNSSTIAKLFLASEDDHYIVTAVFQGHDNKNLIEISSWKFTEKTCTRTLSHIVACNGLNDMIQDIKINDDASGCMILFLDRITYLPIPTESRISETGYTSEDVFETHEIQDDSPEPTHMEDMISEISKPEKESSYTSEIPISTSTPYHDTVLDKESDISLLTSLSLQIQNDTQDNRTTIKSNSTKNEKEGFDETTEDTESISSSVSKSVMDDLAKDVTEDYSILKSQKEIAEHESQINFCDIPAQEQTIASIHQDECDIDTDLDSPIQQKEMEDEISPLSILKECTDGIVLPENQEDSIHTEDQTEEYSCNSTISKVSENCYVEIGLTSISRYSHVKCSQDPNQLAKPLPSNDGEDNFDAADMEVDEIEYTATEEYIASLKLPSDRLNMLCVRDHDEYSDSRPRVVEKKPSEHITITDKTFEEIRNDPSKIVYKVDHDGPSNRHSTVTEEKSVEKFGVINYTAEEQPSDSLKSLDILDTEDVSDSRSITAEKDPTVPIDVDDRVSKSSLNDRTKEIQYMPNNEIKEYTQGPTSSKKSNPTEPYLDLIQENISESVGTTESNLDKLLSNSGDPSYDKTIGSSRNLELLVPVESPTIDKGLSHETASNVLEGCNYGNSSVDTPGIEPSSVEDVSRNSVSLYENDLPDDVIYHKPHLSENTSTNIPAVPTSDKGMPMRRENSVSREPPTNGGFIPEPVIETVSPTIALDLYESDELYIYTLIRYVDPSCLNVFKSILQPAQRIEFVSKLNIDDHIKECALHYISNDTNSMVPKDPQAISAITLPNDTRIKLDMFWYLDNGKYKEGIDLFKSTRLDFNDVTRVVHRLSKHFDKIDIPEVPTESALDFSNRNLYKKQRISLERTIHPESSGSENFKKGKDLETSSRGQFIRSKADGILKKELSNRSIDDFLALATTLEEHDILSQYCWEHPEPISKLFIMHGCISRCLYGDILILDSMIKKAVTDGTIKVDKKIYRCCSLLADVARGCIPKIVLDLPLEIFGRPAGRAGNPFLGKVKGKNGVQPNDLQFGIKMLQMALKACMARTSMQSTENTALQTSPAIKRDLIYNECWNNVEIVFNDSRRKGKSPQEILPEHFSMLQPRRKHDNSGTVEDDLEPFEHHNKKVSL